MSYTIITDSSANLPTSMLEEKRIPAIPLTYIMDGRQHVCEDTARFHDEEYYKYIKNGGKVNTAQINPQQYIDCFKPRLEQGEDILFVGMSSGISGSYHSAEIAAAELRQEFPQRKLYLVDTLGASLGEGLAVIRAADCRDKGMPIEETAQLLLSRRKYLKQLVVLDDLMHLRRSGRISGAAAVAGTVLGIKPILRGNREGKLVVSEKVRGRKQALNTLVKKYEALVRNNGEQTVGIAYTDCPEDAAAVEELLNDNLPPRDILTVVYEPVTGSHVGPGTVAIFFEGMEEAE